MNLSSLSPDMSSELYAILLKLRPVRGGQGATLMPFSGELVHAAFFEWINSTEPGVAAALHEGNKRRLFTCSSLLFPLPVYKIHDAERNNTYHMLHTDTIYTIRVTLLLNNLFPLLYHAFTNAQSQQAQPYSFIRLSEQAFILETIVVSRHFSEWTDATTFQKLVEGVRQEMALQAQIDKAFPLTLEFNSLTTFHRSDPPNSPFGAFNAMLPLPQYVFPPLARRWHELAPPELANFVQRERIERYIDENGIVIHDYALRPHHVSFTNPKDGHTQRTVRQRGFIGSCTYHLRGPEKNPTKQYPLTIRQQLLLLARLAFYTGVGYRTAMGMGRVRVL